MISSFQLPVKKDEIYRLTRREMTSPRRSVEEFVRALQAALESGIPVALADVAFVNGADLLLGMRLLQTGLAPKLSAYAGWNTAGNTLGTVLAQAALSILMQRGAPSPAQKAARVAFLFRRYLDDYYYQAVERTHLLYEDLPALGLAPTMERLPADKLVAVEERLQARLSAAAGGTARQLRAGRPGPGRVRGSYSSALAALIRDRIRRSSGATMTLSPVSLNGNYFTRGGQRFLPVGAHWVPAKTGLGWPVEWDEADLEADFARMAGLGFNTVRFDLFWAWFEPRPGDYNPEAFRQLDVFIRLAHQYSIYLHPALFIGGEVGEAFWDLPWRQGRHPHADPEMLRLQTDHAAQFARRYQVEPAILAWDLTDEPPFWIVGDRTTDAMAINWTRLVAGALRREDPGHLLCVGTSMEDVAHGPFRPDNLRAEMDFFSVHPYSIYAANLFPDPMLSERGTYAGAFETTLSLGAGRPVMIHEFGASSAQYDPERIAAFDRVILYSGLAAGACGFLPWCYTDAAPGLFRRVPYLRAPHETQFGLTTWDRQERPPRPGAAGVQPPGQPARPERPAACPRRSRPGHPA